MWISQIFLSSCSVTEKEASFRSILQRKLFSWKYFKQCKSSVLKCLHGINLLRAFKVIHEQFPLSFFLIRKILLRNLTGIWCYTFYSSFVQYFHYLLIYYQFLGFGHCHLFWNGITDKISWSWVNISQILPKCASLHVNCRFGIFPIIKLFTKRLTFGQWI